MCGNLKLSLQRVQGGHIMEWILICLAIIMLSVEDTDGDEDTDIGPAAGWEVLRDPKRDLVIGSQIGVKVC